MQRLVYPWLLNGIFGAGLESDHLPASNSRGRLWLGILSARAPLLVAPRVPAKLLETVAVHVHSRCVFSIGCFASGLPCLTDQQGGTLTIYCVLGVKRIIFYGYLAGSFRPRYISTYLLHTHAVCAGNLDLGSWPRSKVPDGINSITESLPSTSLALESMSETRTSPDVKPTAFARILKPEPVTTPGNSNVCHSIACITNVRFSIKSYAKFCRKIRYVAGLQLIPYIVLRTLLILDGNTIQPSRHPESGACNLLLDNRASSLEVIPAELLAGNGFRTVREDWISVSIRNASCAGFQPTCHACIHMHCTPWTMPGPC